MQKVTLGKSGLVVPKNGFGALPIQRISVKESVYLLQKALDNGLYYFDTARFYTDSEEKMGIAFVDRRDKVIISTKTGSTTVDGFYKDLETSLRLLKTDYIDLYQFHNLDFCPKPGDKSGIYDAMMDVVKQGKVRHVGLTNHRLAVAKEAIISGLYETIQFPFSYISSKDDYEIVELSKKYNMGYIAMKALAGGLITDSALAYAFMDQFDNVVPIWGVQRENELDEFITYQNNPPVLTQQMKDKIEQEKAILSGNFCRGCAYCQPCPAGIEIESCNRMSLFLRRAPYEVYLTEDFSEKMKKIDDCKHCGQCKKKCPYGLDIPELLKKNYEDFKQFWAHKSDYLK